MYNNSTEKIQKLFTIILNEFLLCSLAYNYTSLYSACKMINVFLGNVSAEIAKFTKFFFCILKKYMCII